MHLDFFVRGKLEQIYLFEAFCQSQMFQFNRINLNTKKTETKALQGALRKSILGAYEWIIPKESFAEALAMLGRVSETDGCFTKPESLAHKFKLSIIRKVFGDRKIPKEIYKKASQIQTNMTINKTTRCLGNLVFPGISVHIIGYKEDRLGEIAGFYQELL